jgi:hypothetical protein
MFLDDVQAGKQEIHSLHHRLEDIHGTVVQLLADYQHRILFVALALVALEHLTQLFQLKWNHRGLVLRIQTFFKNSTTLRQL